MLLNGNRNFSQVYLMVLKEKKPNSQKEEIQQSKAVEPEKEYKLIEEIRFILTTPKETFMYYCSLCHGKSANGKGIYFYN